MDMFLHHQFQEVHLGPLVTHAVGQMTENTWWVLPCLPKVEIGHPKLQMVWVVAREGQSVVKSLTRADWSCKVLSHLVMHVGNLAGLDLECLYLISSHGKNVILRYSSKNRETRITVVSSGIFSINGKTQHLIHDTRSSCSHIIAVS